MFETGKELRFEAWLRQVDAWANRHGILRRQAVSIMFDDSPFAGPDQADRVTMRNLYWAESNDFASRVLYDE